MNKKIPEIHETTNYKMFKSILGNRIIDKYNLTHLVQSIAKKNLLVYNPIIVNERMEVIDGQHRLRIAKENEYPVYYVVAEGTNLSDVQSLNTAKAKWRMQDYITSYIMQGKKDYVIFQEFLDEHKISARLGLHFLKGTEGGAMYIAVKNGTFTVTPERQELGEERINLWEELKPFFLDTGYFHIEYVRAICNLSDRGLGKEFVNKLKVSGNPMIRRGRQIDYLRFFEDTLNWRKQQGTEKVSLTA